MIRRKNKLAVLEEGFRGKVLVAGDIHGDLKAFEKAKAIFEKEEGAVLVFLGDYADRGENGLEVIRGICELLDRHPDRVVALKGNHEDYRDGRPWFSPWTLGWEVEEKLGISWERFYPELEARLLNRLCLGFLIPGFALCVHGGICRAIAGEEMLANPTPEIEEAVLWSDPGESEGERANPRGAGILFGPDITGEVVRNLNVRFILRGHEPQKALLGPYAEHEGRVITTSCTAVYGGRPFVLRVRPEKHRTPEELTNSAVYL